MYKFGWKKDSGKHPRRHFVAAVGATPVGHADLRSHAPAVMNQFLCGSCVGHGTSMAISTAYALIGKPLFGLDGKQLPIPCSQRDLYAGARVLDRASSNTPLEDNGTEVLSAIEFSSQFGVRKTEAPMTDTYNGQIVRVNSDCVSTNVNDEPTLRMLVQDHQNIVPMAHQILTTGASRVRDIKLALDAGSPVVFGTFVDQSFLDYMGGIVGAQDQNDPNGGGHCMCLLGYDGDTFIGRNSWDVTWGNAGDFSCSTSFISQIDELFSVVVS